MLKKIFLGAGVVLTIPAAAFVAFFFWASSGTLSAHEFDRGRIIVAPGLEARAPHNPLAIVTYNVGYGSGLTNNTGTNASEAEYEEHLQTIIEALRAVQPDFVAFQEIDYDSHRSYNRDQLSLIADALGLKYRAQAFNWDKTYLPFPYWPPSSHFGAILSGQALASAFPIIEQRKVTLIKPDERPFYYNRFYLDRLVQITRVEMQDQTLTILNVHLEAYMNRTRQKQTIEVADVVAHNNDGPLILLGDFNAQPPWINGGADENGRPDVTLANILERTGLRKAIPEEAYANAPDNRHATFRSDDPSVYIDHIFYNSRIERLSARVLADAGTGSDHLPVLMTFRLRPPPPGTV